MNNKEFDTLKCSTTFSNLPNDKPLDRANTNLTQSFYVSLKAEQTNIINKLENLF